MEDVAHDFENDEDPEEGNDAGHEEPPERMMQTQNRQERPARGERGRARRRPNNRPSREKAAQIGPR